MSRAAWGVGAGAAPGARAAESAAAEVEGGAASGFRQRWGCRHSPREAERPAADTIHRALTMDPEERRLRAARLNEIVRERDPGVWISEQLNDIRAKREAMARA